MEQGQFDNGSSESTMSLTQSSGIFTGQKFSRMSIAKLFKTSLAKNSKQLEKTKD